MKLLATLRNRMRKNLLKNQGGQGATEYILLLVVVVGVVMAFGPKIKSAMNEKMGALKDGMDGVTTEM